MPESCIDLDRAPTAAATEAEPLSLVPDARLAWLELHARLSDYALRHTPGTPPAQRGEMEGGS